MYGTEVKSSVGPTGSQREGAAAHRHFEAHTAGSWLSTCIRLDPEAFRAGHAAEFCRQWQSLGVILQSGDWKSAAYLAYCNQGEVDAAAFLAAQIEHSDTDD